MRKEAAPAALTKAIYEKLAKQDIVDEQFGAYLNGALYGNITTKGGNGTGTQLTEDAKHAVDVLMQMHNNPAIGPDYVAKMIPNSYTRALFNTVLLMDGGRYGFDQTLLKAHELMQNKNFNPDDRINMDTNFQKMVSKGTSDAIEAAVTRPGWFGGSELTPDQRRDVVKNNRAAEEYVKAQANLYHIQFPQTDPEVNIKQAVEDLGRDAMVVGGNVIIGRTDQKQRLDQVMGLEGADKTLPQQAINATVERLGPSVFGALWDEAKKKNNPSLWNMATQPIGVSYAQTNRTPPYYATYNPQSGVMAVQLVEEKNGYKNPIGNPMYINVRASGARYKAALRLPSALGNTIRVVKDDLVDKKQNYEGAARAAEVGAELGTMINK
jgi:hypothetical protein